MPDWLTHVLVGYAISKTLGLRFSAIGEKETALIVFGSLLPDGVKLGYLFEFFGIYLWKFLVPLGTVAGAVLSSFLLSLLFKEEIKTFLLLFFGSAAHIFLDLFTTHATPSPPIFFPFNWSDYEIGIIRSDDYRITALAIVLALSVYAITNIKAGMTNKTQ